MSHNQQLQFRYLCYDWVQKASTVKHMYNDHSWSPKRVAVVDNWSLFGGRYLEVVVILGLKVQMCLVIRGIYVLQFWTADTEFAYKKTHSD
jgi:hypothetical protein